MLVMEVIVSGRVMVVVVMVMVVEVDADVDVVEVSDIREEKQISPTKHLNKETELALHSPMTDHSSSSETVSITCLHCLHESNNIMVTAGNLGRS